MRKSRMLISKAKKRYKVIDGKKTATGAFFTKKSSWLTKPVRRFIEKHIASNGSILDPFAGNGDLLDSLHADYEIAFHGYDIQNSRWPENDSLLHIPNPHKSIICTNPPYLAKHSAKRKGVWEKVRSYYDNHYDLYELAIYKSMENAIAGVFIIPETFLHSNFSKQNLSLVSVILDNPFIDTENPVCVACFDKSRKGKGYVYIQDDYLCPISKIDRSQYKISRNRDISFNNAHGNIALKAVDGVKPDDRIRFERPDTFYYRASNIKETSRLMTYIRIEGLDKNCLPDFLSLANRTLNHIRDSTSDLILSPFKGNNKSGIRRRRLDYALARYILSQSMEQIRPGTRLQGSLF